MKQSLQQPWGGRSPRACRGLPPATPTFHTPSGAFQRLGLGSQAPTAPGGAGLGLELRAPAAPGGTAGVRDHSSGLLGAERTPEWHTPTTPGLPGQGPRDATGQSEQSQSSGPRPVSGLPRSLPGPVPRSSRLVYLNAVTEKAKCSVHSPLPGRPPPPGPGEAEARSLELLPGLPCGRRGPGTRAIACCFPRPLAGVGWEVGQRGLEQAPLWDAGVSGGSFTHCAIEPAPRYPVAIRHSR